MKAFLTSLVFVFGLILSPASTFAAATQFPDAQKSTFQDLQDMKADVLSIFEQKSDSVRRNISVVLENYGGESFYEETQLSDGTTILSCCVWYCEPPCLCCKIQSVAPAPSLQVIKP